MRSTVFALFSVLLLFSGCIELVAKEENAGVPAMDPCDAPLPSNLHAQDTLFLRPNMSYQLRLHDHGPLWGELTLQSCGENPVTPKLESQKLERSLTASPYRFPDQFFFAYLVPSGAEPVPVIKSWELTGPNPRTCKLESKGSEGYFYALPAATSWKLVVAAVTPYETITIETGKTPRTEAVIDWTLKEHPDLQIKSIKPAYLSQIAPDAFRVEWQERNAPQSPMMLHVGSLTRRSAEFSAGTYSDRLRLQTGSGTFDEQRQGQFACTPFDGSEILSTIDAYSVAKEEFQLTRSYRQSVSAPQPRLDLVLLQVPMAAPAQPS